MCLVRDTDAEHEQTSRHKEGGNRDNRKTHLWFKDSPITSSRPLAQLVVDVSAKERSNQIPDAGTQEHQSLLADAEIVRRSSEIDGDQSDQYHDAAEGR